MAFHCSLLRHGCPASFPNLHLPRQLQLISGFHFPSPAAPSLTMFLSLKNPAIQGMLFMFIQRTNYVLGFLNKHFIQSLSDESYELPAQRSAHYVSPCRLCSSCLPGANPLKVCRWPGEDSQAVTAKNAKIIPKTHKCPSHNNKQPISVHQHFS